MAEHLVSIFGIEKDRVNCPFYFKIGAFRHGDRCSRLHTKSSISPTLLLPNMFQRPIDPLKMQQHFEVKKSKLSIFNFIFFLDFKLFCGYVDI
ncbi:hypothetical protein RDI58_000477 [Solanum bulbocastanum]|uniref:C3H1-type domain-containing protein n=1 Tax=Solanum bulbocastanum TaxID=147425 RepID=A0AAN8YP55_SOLBU